MKILFKPYFMRDQAKRQQCISKDLNIYVNRVADVIVFIVTVVIITIILIGWIP